MSISKNRVESFSDGVIAVSLTLMLFQLQVPEGFALKDILGNAYNFFGYVLSFYLRRHLLEQPSSPVQGRSRHQRQDHVGEPEPAVLADHGAVHHHRLKSDFAQTPTAMYAFVLFMCSVSYSLLTRLILRSGGEHSELRQAIGSDLKGSSPSRSTPWRSRPAFSAAQPRSPS